MDIGTVTSTATAQREKGRIYYVATDGDNGNPGTEAQPFRTITKGVGVLGPGDTLYVKSGTYVESLGNFPSGQSWDAPVTIAADPGSLVVVRPSSGGFVAHFTDCHHVVLDGLVLDGSKIDHFAIKITSEAHHIRIQNSEIKNAPMSGIHMATYGAVRSDYNEFLQLDIHHNGTTDFDHGIYIETSNNLIDHCIVHHNAGWGVHIYSGSSRSANNNTVSNSRIHSNASAGDRGPGIILSSGSGNIAYNNLIWGNSGGIQVDNGASGAKVFNNVVYANSTYGIRVGNSIGAIIRNNIVYRNEGAISDAGFLTTKDHNLVDIDPEFMDASGHDFRLRPTSPAIDAGTALSEVPRDFDGVATPRGAGYDIGAYETPYSSRVSDLRVVTAVGGRSSLTVTLRWTAPVGAVAYALRRSNRLLTEANQIYARNRAAPLTASEPGNTGWLTIPVAYTLDTVYLALKSQNGTGTWSRLSSNAFWPHGVVYLPLTIRDHVSPSRSYRSAALLPETCDEVIRRTDSVDRHACRSLRGG